MITLSRLVLAGISGAALVALAACQEERREAQVFETEAACKDAATEMQSWWTEEGCAQAFAQAQDRHLNNAPRYDALEVCEAEHGEGACGEDFLPGFGRFELHTPHGRVLHGPRHERHAVLPDLAAALRLRAGRLLLGRRGHEGVVPYGHDPAPQLLLQTGRADHRQTADDQEHGGQERRVRSRLHRVDPQIGRWLQRRKLTPPAPGISRSRCP